MKHVVRPVLTVEGKDVFWFSKGGLKHRWIGNAEPYLLDKKRRAGEIVSNIQTGPSITMFGSFPVIEERAGTIGIFVPVSK